ncbi:hypothetical protein CW755_07545 [Geobacillus thermodenitrificans]|nr:hypothetical protein CW755_07545 [Geobacillus thermodenitrificans]
MLVHREHLLGLFVSLLTFYRKGALFSIPFGFYWIINTPDFGIYFCQFNRSIFLLSGNNMVIHSSRIHHTSLESFASYYFSNP